MKDKLVRTFWWVKESQKRKVEAKAAKLKKDGDKTASGSQVVRDLIDKD